MNFPPPRVGGGQGEGSARVPWICLFPKLSLPLNVPRHGQGRTRMGRLPRPDPYTSLLRPLWRQMGACWSPRPPPPPHLRRPRSLSPQPQAPTRKRQVTLRDRLCATRCCPAASLENATPTSRTISQTSC